MSSLSLRFRKFRRFVVLAHFMSLVGAILLVNLHVHTLAVSWAISGVFVVYLAAGLCLASVTWPYGLNGFLWKPSPSLDERQKSVRANAFAYSYWITSLLIVLAFLWIMAAQYSDLVWRPRTMSEWLWVFCAGVVVNSMLPPAMIAWSEPDMLESPTSESTLAHNIS